MATLKQLAARMNARAEKLDTLASDEAVVVALDIIGALAVKTPVDVTTALSGWQIALGAPAAARRNAFYPGEKGSTFNASLRATIDDARVALSAKKPGQPIYISNLEPYIRRLNTGYSNQHPGGFIEAGVIVGTQNFRDRRNRG